MCQNRKCQIILYVNRIHKIGKSPEIVYNCSIIIISYVFRRSRKIYIIVRKIVVMRCYRRVPVGNFFSRRTKLKTYKV